MGELASSSVADLIAQFTALETRPEARRVLRLLDEPGRREVIKLTRSAVNSAQKSTVVLLGALGLLGLSMGELQSLQLISHRTMLAFLALGGTGIVMGGLYGTRGQSKRLTDAASALCELDGPEVPLVIMRWLRDEYGPFTTSSGLRDAAR